MADKSKSRSQVMDLFLHVAEQLGFGSDRAVAELAEVAVESVGNWRSGSVSRFKTSKLDVIKRNLARRLVQLLEQAQLTDPGLRLGLHPLEIEAGSGPADLQRQFRERVAYDYLGHRFLYFEPQGALAWESLIRAGYEQERWLAGVDACLASWLDRTRDGQGQRKGPLAHALWSDRRGALRGLDVISLGPGEGGKERLVLERLFDFEATTRRRFQWLSYAPVDVSIPLLLTAAKKARDLLAERADEASAWRRTVCAFSADFEEGPLSFMARLPSSRAEPAEGSRLVLVLGNVFGNVRDEDTFVRQKLWPLVRTGDHLWLEVGLRVTPVEQDPLFRMTQERHAETAAEANRRLLLEGPYRRWEAALGRRPADLAMRIWVREDDDSARVTGSINFCHDLLIQDERRVCTMLYSRRYQLEGLTRWFERRSFSVERVSMVSDSKKRGRVAHLLLRRR